MLRRNNPNMPLQDIKRMHIDQFPDWFEYIVDNEHLHDDEVVRTDLQWLAKGPDTILGKCNRFVINGYRFRTKDVNEQSKTQNRGVVVTARTTNDEDVTYYGKLIDIIELNYYGTRKVVLFQCDWVQDRAVKKDRYGFTFVNFNRRLVTKEPYVLASQVLQVFYVPDPIEKEWDVAIKILPRDLFKMFTEDEETDDVDPNDVDPNDLDPTLPIEAEIDPQIGPTMVDVDIRPNEVRPNVPAIPVDESTINNQAGEDEGILYDG
ncbi:hypothetical protein L1049_015955 [Liquidambar formosana]|uniref:DUF4216 domain-containing protein n=1 Tax=Liquidambar formosana TaxID=63359 RepID=A0AAP0RZU7_LIQFO